LVFEFLCLPFLAKFSHRGECFDASVQREQPGFVDFEPDPLPFYETRTQLSVIILCVS
jgi:hypothetical protein